MELPSAVASVTRVTRPDTLLIRTQCPQLQSMVSLYMVLVGIRPGPWLPEDVIQAIVDWIEVHADAERLHLVYLDWVRDDYGRFLGDLADIQTGERLTDYLISIGAATKYEHHYTDVVERMLRSQEPEL